MLNQVNYTTSEKLSNLIHVSPRTITRYIKDINYEIKKYNAEISSSKGLGYIIMIPEEKKKEILKIIQMTSEENQTENEDYRKEKIICIILNEKRIDIDKLSLELNLSPARISQLLEQVKIWGKKYSLTLIWSSIEGYMIEGKEENIRSFIVDILVDKNINTIKEFYKNISKTDMYEVKRIIRNRLAEENILLSDFDFKNLYLEVLTSIFRIKKHKVISEFDELAIPKIISDITKDISFNLGISIPRGESSRINSEIGEIINSYLVNNNPKVIEFVENSLSEFDKNTGKSYSEDFQLFNSLVMHIELFIKRSSKGIKTDNPMIVEIKKSFPLEFDMAALMGIDIEKLFKVKLNENEIGFLTLHFASYEERATKEHKIRVIIICHYGIGTSELLKEKLKRKYEEFQIIGVYPEAFIDIAFREDPDIIISTVPITQKYSKPIIYIENIFTDEIFTKINHSLNESIHTEQKIKQLFSESLFFKIEALNSLEVIQKMSDKLVEMNITSTEVIKQVIDREKISPTDIGNLVAIPHTISSAQRNSFISVGILEKPIFWSKEKVQLVFLACFNNEDTKNQDIFRFLYNFIQDQGAVKSIINFADYKMFIDILTNKK